MKSSSFLVHVLDFSTSSLCSSSDFSFCCCRRRSLMTQGHAQVFSRRDDVFTSRREWINLRGIIIITMIINLLLHPTILYLIFIMNSFVIHPSILVSFIFLSSLSLFFSFVNLRCVCFGPPKRSFFFLCFLPPLFFSLSHQMKCCSSQEDFKWDLTQTGTRRDAAAGNYIRSVCMKKTYSWRLPLLLFQEKEWKRIGFECSCWTKMMMMTKPSLLFLLACLFSRREFLMFFIQQTGHIPSPFFYTFKHEWEKGW